MPLRYDPSKSGLLALKLALFCLNGCLLPMNHAALAVAILWQAGYLSMISLPSRFTLEASGAVGYAAWTWQQQQKTGDIDKALERAARLTIGARSPVELPWGEPATLQSISVLDFVDRLALSGYVDAREDYEFLCESSHPSFIQSGFWNIASTPATAFKNPLFDSRMAVQLERTVSCLENATSIAASISGTLLRELLPVIENDESSPRSG